MYIFYSLSGLGEIEITRKSSEKNAPPPPLNFQVKDVALRTAKRGRGAASKKIILTLNFVSLFSW